jgi:hypothetical protein
MYRGIYLSGEWAMAAVIAALLFCALEYLAKRRDSKTWRYVLLFSPFLVGMVVGTFLPCVNPTPDDSAFLAAVLIAFGGVFAVRFARLGVGLERIVAGFFLLVYGTFCLLAIYNFTKFLVGRYS